MKTILLVVICTVVYICGMCFIENKRTENINKINLEYQQALIDLNAESNVEYLPVSQDDDSSSEEEESSEIKVNLTGEVKNEGVYTITKGDYLDTVLRMAGGPNENADIHAFDVDYVIDESMDIYIPKVNDGNKLSINTANVETLDLLPGIGSVLAGRIVEYRNLIGGFRNINELTKVEGLGESIFNKLKDYVIL